MFVFYYSAGQRLPNVCLVKGQSQTNLTEEIIS
jgi:hypothetical protein